MNTFVIREQSELPGLRDLLPDTAQEVDERLLAQYGELVKEAELPFEPTMGLGEDLRRFVDRLIHRKLVRELPEEVRSLPWFSCHVPPGGSTTVKSKVVMQAEGGLSMKIFGSGLGAGRKIQLEVASESEARKECATYALDCRIRPRVYDCRGEESVELDVIECVGDSVESLTECPGCAALRKGPGPFDHREGPHVDRRKDKVLTKRHFKLAIEDSVSIQAGLKFATIPVELSLMASLTHGTTFEIENQFPPGRLYRGYEHTRPDRFETLMWIAQP